jgi:hypothetical protein
LPGEDQGGVVGALHRSPHALAVPLFMEQSSMAKKQPAAQDSTTEPIPVPVPTLGALRDAHLIFFEHQSTEGQCLRDVLGSSRDPRERARLAQAAAAFSWLDCPLFAGLRHHITERFGSWDGQALLRARDWLMDYRGLSPEQAAGIGAEELLELLKQTAGPSEEPEWSIVMDTGKLRTIFDLSQDTLSKRLKNQIILNKKHSNRRYQIALTQLPVEDKEHYRERRRH